MVAKKGKEPTDNYFSSLLDRGFKNANVSQVKGAALFYANTWFFGFLPSMQFVGIGASGSGMLRVLADGELLVVCFEINSLMKAIAAVGPKESAPTTIAALRDINIGMEAPQLNALIAKGAKVFHGKAGLLASFYLPAGWMVAEKVPAGDLIDGLRKAVIQESSSARILSRIARPVRCSCGGAS